MKKSGILYRFLYIIAIISGLLLALPAANAQVNQSEMDNLGPVEFINYEGPYSRIETRAQIRAIGYGLGQAVRAGNARAGAAGRYFVIHAAGEPDGSKLDADIFGFGPDIGVDHIRNLRFIVQGYLEAAYEYTESDAALLAEYITVYNAVYRGDLGFFDTRYKTPVMENLTAEKAGLAIRYDEWPGQTLMVIPLGTGLGGPLSSIDTTTITDPRVTEQLRQEPDMSIEQRQDMVDLKEREADEANQQATITREAIRQEEERIAQEREQARLEQERIAREREEILRQQQEQQNAQQQQETQQRQEELDEQEQEVQQRQEELNEEEEALEEQRQEAEQQETFAEEKSAEAQEERQQIAEDQQTVISQEPVPAQPEGVLGVSILVPATSLGRLVLLDNTGKEVKQSPLNTVNARTVTDIGGRIFAVAGLAQGSGAVRLVEIDGATLEMKAQGNDDIAPQSLLWANGQNLYAITSSGGSLNMARFNTDLVLQARSAITAHPFASVFFNGNFLITQREDGSAALLNPQDLTESR